VKVFVVRPTCYYQRCSHPFLRTRKYHSRVCASIEISKLVSAPILEQVSVDADTGEYRPIPDASIGLTVDDDE